MSYVSEQVLITRIHCDSNELDLIMAFDDDFKLADLVIDDLNWNVRCMVLELFVGWQKIWTL